MIKSLILLIIINFSLVYIQPSQIGNISLYNSVLAGRERLPFGEDSEHSYNVSIFNLNAMFASHVINGTQKKPDEYRVLVLGDSSVWGILLHPDETLSGIINESHLSQCGLKIKAYNIAYPTISITKDLILLDYAMRYRPDLIIWPITLEAFPSDKQLSSPIVANNATLMKELIRTYNLPLNFSDPAFDKQSLFDKTLLGQRRNLADLFRLQMYGFMWTATGIDQVYPSNYQKAQIDLDPDTSFHDFQQQILSENQLAFSELEAGMVAARNIPVLLINEPILISDGKNSDLRYDFYYPHWAYDQYRNIMVEKSLNEGWNYLDLWDLVPEDMFTNSAIHLSSNGEFLFAQKVIEFMTNLPCK
jgi:hypothetical protein